MHTVLCQTIGKKFELKEKETLFDGFSRNGTELPHGCIAGSCGACLIEVHSGSENLTEAKTIEKETLNSIYKAKNIDSNRSLRLSCRARVNGPCEFSLFHKKTKAQED